MKICFQIVSSFLEQGASGITERPETSLHVCLHGWLCVPFDLFCHIRKETPYKQKKKFNSNCNVLLY